MAGGRWPGPVAVAGSRDRPRFRLWGRGRDVGTSLPNALAFLFDIARRNDQESVLGDPSGHLLVLLRSIRPTPCRSAAGAPPSRRHDSTRCHGGDPGCNGLLAAVLGFAPLSLVAVGAKRLEVLQHGLAACRPRLDVVYAEFETRSCRGALAHSGNSGSDPGALHENATEEMAGVKSSWKRALSDVAARFALLRLPRP